VTHHLVVGAGNIGLPLAERLAQRGDTVTVATRSGSRAEGAGSVVLNASDPQAFIRAASGVDTIFLCTNPPYTDWAVQWPPIFNAAIQAAAASGAGLVVMSNMYAYGSPTGAMTEHSPELTTEKKGMIRRDGWAAVRAAHDRGDIRAVEVRASDYFGPAMSGAAHLGDTFFHAILRSKSAHVVGRPEAAHSWSYLPDIVTTLMLAADYPDAWGRVWHVPSATFSRDQIARQLNLQYGTHGSIAPYPQWMLRGVGALNPMMREVWTSSYQFMVPFVLDSAETERLLGASATPWNDALFTTAESYRG